MRITTSGVMNSLETTWFITNPMLPIIKAKANNPKKMRADKS